MNKKTTLIVADDTTGANASGILLSSLGLDVFNVIVKSNNISCDVITIGTETRAVPPDFAYQKVYGQLELNAENFMIYNKRIDSTLRGNIGIEIQAFFDYFKQDRKVIIVPSFPDSHRICTTGHLYVNDVLLENTEIAKDPKMPLTTSDVKVLFEKDNQLKYDTLFLSFLRQGEFVFREELLGKLKDCDALIIDASTNEDIDLIAKTITELHIDVICADPGPFTQKMTMYRLKTKKQYCRHLFVIGSVVDTTLTQLKYINEIDAFDMIYVDPTLFLKQGYENHIKELVAMYNVSEHKNIIFTTTDINDPLMLDLNQYAKEMNMSVDDVSNLINDGLATLTLTAMKNSNKQVDFLYTSGGDVSISVLKMANASGLHLIREILPLTVHSKILGGIFNGINLVTKGGAIGLANTIEIIANYMEE